MGGWGSGAWGARRSFGVAVGGGGGSSDTTPPSVFGFSPADGTPIHATDAIAFNVGDETALRRVIVWAEYNDGRRTEVIHDGDAFTYEFAAGSTRSPGAFFSGGLLIGYAFSVRRLHGWPSAVTIRVEAVDRSGNEAS